uniref:Uncharacterized protein n=1 Tax=Meloidogyne incognita TaxID=6306 RepID=A0A914KRS4_MELIC
MTCTRILVSGYIRGYRRISAGVLILYMYPCPCTDCIKRKCTQNVLYKVDLGYSKVRRSAEGTLTNYSQSMVRRNNEMLEEIAIKNSQMQNDAFQPFLYSEFKCLIELFYNGNKRIFALFNISMEELINEKLEIVEKNNYCDNKLLPEFEKIKKELLQIIENNWKKINCFFK